MGNRFIYLVRHGQYDPALKDQGALTKRGEAQAQQTAKMLETLPITAVHCSTTLRAMQTTSIIVGALGELEIQPSALLNECIPALTPQLSEYYRTTKTADEPSQEELARCVAQLDEAYECYFQPTEGDDAYELIVCHGNVIRYFITRVLGVAPEVWVKFAIYNCGVSLVVVDVSGSTALITHNEVAHLAYDLRTHS